mgnify:CR=1 FL=1
MDLNASISILRNAGVGAILNYLQSLDLKGNVAHMAAISGP